MCQLCCLRSQKAFRQKPLANDKPRQTVGRTKHALSEAKGRQRVRQNLINAKGAGLIPQDGI